MINFFISVIIIFSLLVGWIFIQQAAKKLAAKHPEFGPAKEEGSGCGKTCGCRQGSCYKDD